MNKMDSWESLVLQWINCLWENKSECIRSLEQLEDGKIYYKLISKIKPWNSKEYFGSEKEMVFQFLQEEYPMYKFQSKSNRIKILSAASLVLCRLSLEAIFHDSLCTNLSDDMQIKIKLILESIYQLGKKITEDDIFKIFSLSKKPEFESPALKPKFLLEEFLKSPITRTVQSDNKLHEQSRQLRKLRADIETLSYEKSELIEDIKTQEKQIKELKIKLHETLIELKSLRQSNHKLNDEKSSVISNSTSVELTYKREVESLEKYVAELQNENYQLQDEKSLLADEIKIYKEKYSEMKEKNQNNEQMVESMLLQIEKKEEELADLKLRHEELSNHLKEKSKLFLNNLSFEVEDRTFTDSSFNRSEALSSVVEVQLQDTKRELTVMHNNFKYINTILTTLIEEYEKLKRKVESAAKVDTQIAEEITDLKNCSPLKIEKKLSLADIFKSDSKRILFFDVLKNTNFIQRSNDFNFMTFEKRHADDLLDQGERLKSLVKYEGCKRNNFVDKFVCTFHNTFWQKYWNKQLFVLLKIVLQEITKSKIESAKDSELSISLVDVKKYKDYTNNDIYIELLNFVKNNCDVVVTKSKETKCVAESTQTDVKDCSSISIQTDVKSYSTMSIQTDSKEYSSKPVQTDTKTVFSSSSQTDIKNYFSTFVQTDIKEYSIIPTQTEEKNYSSISIQTEKIDEPLLNPDEIKSLESNWTQLTEFIESDSTLFENILRVEKNWKSTLESLNNITMNYNTQAQSEMTEIFTEKGTIENAIKDIQNHNLKMLLLNFMTSVEMVKNITNTCNIQTKVEPICNKNLVNKFPHLLSDFDITSEQIIVIRNEVQNKIKKVQKEINNFDSLLKNFEEKLKSAAVNVLQNDVKENLKCEEIPTRLSNEDVSKSPQFQNYVREIHEKYESKLEKMKEKMKSAFNSQILILKKEQEMTLKNKMEALQSKFEDQCLNHTEELKKYKKHIGELTSQLWDVGEKLIIEKQKKEEFMKRFKELRGKYENIENQHVPAVTASARPRPEANASHIADISLNTTKMQNLRGFQMMGNAFSNEDEEGEVFDSTCLADMQRPRESLSSVDLNRLSILQTRNSKCKPHLKSSYPTEAQLPATLTEDDIKSGNPDDFLNDSLSQSLLTGKKVKRKDRSRNNTGTPRRSGRFSNIFRKPKLSTDHK